MEATKTPHKIYDGRADWICPHIRHSAYHSYDERVLNSTSMTEQEFFEAWYYPNQSFGKPDVFEDFFGKLRKKAPYDPKQPYLYLAGTPLIRPLDAITHVLFPPGVGNPQVDVIYDDALRAWEGRGCLHHRLGGALLGYSDWLYCVGNSPLFFPCEAVGLFGARHAMPILERILAETAALKKLFDGLTAYVKQYPSDGGCLLPWGEIVQDDGDDTSPDDTSNENSAFELPENF